MALNHIPLAVYWTIRSVVACSLQIMGLTSLSNEYLTSTIDAYELAPLAQKLGSSYVYLNNTLALCRQHIYETKQSRASQTLAQLFETNLNDNMKILKALISAHNNLLPLWHGSSETTVLLLLVNGIDLKLLDWVREGKLVILYRGENIQWIRQFTHEVKVVLQSVNAPFEMVYVAKSNPNQRVRKIISIIKAENLSHSWEDLISIWFFWYRIECMWFSKREHNMTIRNDSVMKEIETIFEFGSSDQGWALVSNADDEMAKAKGEIMLMSFKQFDLWNKHVESRGFLHALNDHLRTFETQHYCTRIEIDASSGNIPQSISCVNCGRVMEKIIVFRCYNS